jgi:hypothetical protein
MAAYVRITQLMQVCIYKVFEKQREKMTFYDSIRRNIFIILVSYVRFR